MPRDISQVNIDFCVNERIYRIAPSSLHGFRFFFHGWHKGWLRLMYRIDGVCWTLLQLQILDVPCIIYTKYVYIWVVRKLFTTER